MTSTPKEIRDGIAAARETTERHLGQFAPSPAPASGAETPCPNCGGSLAVMRSSSEPEGIRKDRQCWSCGMFYVAHKSGLVPYSRAAHPTPPSDAGTSERETETHKGRDLEWSRHPLGTKAREVGDDGAYWLRVEGGWTWCTGNIRATPAAELYYEVTCG